MTRAALVTGAARGIGAGVARRLAREGWRVEGCYRANDDAARALVEDAEREGWADRIRLSRCDIGDDDARERWAEAALQRLGPCDALVHAAGPFLRAPLLAQSPRDLRALYDANVIALHALACAVAPAMRARRFGRIVAFGLASTPRASAPPVIAGYYCAKIAMTALVRALARELAADGITANVVSPGVIDSGGLLPDEVERLRAQVPAGFVGEVDDAVAAVAWLLSEQARYITGAEIPVAGGWGL